MSHRTASRKGWRGGSAVRAQVQPSKESCSRMGWSRCKEKQGERGAAKRGGPGVLGARSLAPSGSDWEPSRPGQSHRSSAGQHAAERTSAPEAGLSLQAASIPAPDSRQRLAGRRLLQKARSTRHLVSRASSGQAGAKGGRRGGGRAGGGGRAALCCCIRFRDHQTTRELVVAGRLWRLSWPERRH